MIRYAMISSASARAIKVEKQLFSTTNNTLMNAEPSASARARIHNTRARMLERYMRLKFKVGSVHCWKRYSFDRSSTRACTPSCSNRWCFAVHRTGIPVG